MPALLVWKIYSNELFIQVYVKKRKAVNNLNLRTHCTEQTFES